MVDYAIVKIWDTLVGAVVWDSKRSLADFQYDKKFLEKKWDISPIKMPISSGDRIYSFPELLPSKENTENTFKGLPGLLADSLPDKYGNLLIDKWLAQNGRAPESMNPIEKLCFIGTRGMGALEFEPSQIKASKNTFSIEIKSLVEIAQKILSNREGFEAKLKPDEQQAMEQILKIGTSAGGARPKALIAFNENTKEVRSGQTKVPIGFSHWLLKLDGVSGVQFGDSHGWGRIEYAYHLMAKECGIEMTDCELLEENGRAHFMTKRFDREGSNTKHHIQTLCGINHFDYNNLFAYGYEQVFQTMRILKLPYPQAEQMFRRMVFNVLATNCDDHTKNFSFRLKKDGAWELAPAYDVCYSFDPTNKWVNQQTLSVNGKHKDINKYDLMAIAKANNVKKGEQIIADINEVVKNWSDFALKGKVNEIKRKEIKSNLHVLKD
ncbi:MAG TPA: type II toxin-antitoxin system HipA family toxin [Tenuifilaceae bacterium]|nr:type II toxin-antitoxin system HipA family toxin [Tenuifilaceae bacterium]HPQ35457.1 type II toxin-antitoxin system HipA family toxin [Tenuifilaceae bacterium]